MKCVEARCSYTALLLRSISGASAITLLVETMSKNFSSARKNVIANLRTVKTLNIPNTSFYMCKGNGLGQTILSPDTGTIEGGLD